MQTNQSTGIQSSDFQVAKYSSGFAMAHKMGLAVMNLKSKNVVTEKTFTFNGTNPTSSTTISTPVSVTASSNFDTYIPYTQSNVRYYVLKATGAATNQSTKFKPLRTEKDYWEQLVNNVGYGKYATYDLYSVREYARFKAVFNYCGTYSYFTVPFYGTYTMEIWGAEGGVYFYSAGNRGGYGGHAKGTVALYYGDPIYVCVGGRGGSVSADGGAFVQSSGFNGGGVPTDTSNPDNVSGGGCTHIARQKGTDSRGQLKGLSAYSNYTTNDVILMVAAGGGGGDGAIGGDGGGPTGGDGTAWQSQMYGAYGATHTGPGATSSTPLGGQNAAGFGFGGWSTGHNSGGGGGGGWYGGGVADGAGGGGGGSGHIATTVTQIAHERSTHTGNGYATIYSD